ncbi:unnamed protein product [Chrysodeixis includens]|uniref:EGF-like domain-containing protein n=1 Tax=Chrysodeixis includens TaxID=689277 RepID=A0A9P0BZS2_CHRIL|nr:unnamed protein product [Chrysodeixis includens]
MRWFIFALLAACACATPQYVKTGGVKGGYHHGSGYQGGANQVYNSTSQHGYGGHGGYSGPRVNPAINFEEGVCYIEVPTASLVRDPSHVPAGNGSRPDLSRIRSCCRGYTRSIYNFLICEPVCSQPCVNGLCVAPETCNCYPDHVQNLEGECIATCPIGCQNGRCAGGECVCNPGFRLDSESKYCIPVCRDDCSRNGGKCVAPNRCECKRGYTSSPDGSCKPDCGRCSNGECVGPNECRCLPGYAKNQTSDCEPQCVNTCSPPNRCIAPNVCSNTLTTTTTAPYYQPIPNVNGIVRPSPPTSDSQHKPTYPGNQQPNYPGNQLPSHPGQQETYPGGQQPGYPGQQPGYPGNQRPSYPGSQQPSYPGSQPSYPGSQQPGYPGGQQPGYPGSQQPSYPGQQSIYPDSQRPGYPGQQPSYPGSHQPGSPGYQQPNSSHSQHPSSPGQQQHTYPGSNLPGLSGYQQPNGPNSQQPGYPTGQYYPGSQHPDHPRTNSPSHSNSSQSPSDREPYYPNSQYYPGSQYPDPQRPYPGQSGSNRPTNDREPYYPNSQYYPGQSYPYNQGPYQYPSQYPNSESQHRYPDSQSAIGQFACSRPCVNGTCVGNDRCACNTGYLPIEEDTSRCTPYCPSCTNGTCMSPYVCVCDEGFYKDFSVKGRTRCVPRRIRRSADDTSAPLNFAKLLTFEIPDYES